MKTNCKQCGHVMDSEALTCPSCHAPNKSAMKMKNCSKCGSEMEARKRKCPNCNEFQTSNNTNNMAKNNFNNSFLGILLGIALGGLIMYFLYPSIKPIQTNNPPKIEKNDAKVQQVDGVLIFIKSEPLLHNTSLGNISHEQVLEIINKLDGIINDESKTVLEKIASGFNETLENVNFHERMRKFVRAAKEQFKPENVDGLIFSGGNLKEANAIKFD